MPLPRVLFFSKTMTRSSKKGPYVDERLLKKLRVKNPVKLGY